MTAGRGDAPRFERISTGLAPYYRALQRPGALLLVLAALCIGKGLLGPGPLRENVRDSFALLDGSWRLWNGQRPFRDFYSDVGPLTFLPTTLALNFARGVSAINWGICFMGIAVAILGVPLVFSRLRRSLATLYCTVDVLLTIAPFAAGDPPTRSTQAMFYNRWGYALLALLLVECVSPEVGSPLIGPFGQGILAGCIVAAAFWLKFTYGILGLLMLVCTAPVRKQSRHRWFGLAAGLTLIGFAGFALQEFDAPAIARCLRLLAQSRHVGISGIIAKPLTNPFRLVCTSGFVAGAIITLHRLGRRTVAARWTWILLVTLAIDAGALATNQYRQPPDFLLTSFAIIPLLSVLMAGGGAGELSVPTRNLLLVWGLSIALVNPALDFAGLVLGAARPRLEPAGYPQDTIASVIPDRIISMEFPNPATGRSYVVEQLNDGLELLRRYSTPGEKIASFTFANPFSYYMRRPPIHGGSFTYDYLINFNETSHLPADFAFGDADVILVPKVGEDGRELPAHYGLFVVYGAFLESHFTPVAESHSWRVYKKK